MVLAWDTRAWTTAHDPPTSCGPDTSGPQLKEAIRASLARSGEDDPTGARLVEREAREERLSLGRSRARGEEHRLRRALDTP
jgi:hypothetical protein